MASLEWLLELVIRCSQMWRCRCFNRLWELSGGRFLGSVDTTPSSDLEIDARCSLHVRTDTLVLQCGTMCYSAPEMLCNKAYGREVDIWSIGVCLYVMLTQRLPYYSPSLTELHAVMLDGAFQPPEGSSDTLTDLLRNLFVVKPERRITIPQMWGHPWLDAPAPAQGRSRAESSSDREGGSRAKGVVGSLSADGKDRGKGTARPPRVDRRPSCVHLNYAVIAAIEADGIGRAAEIEAAVQGNLCNRLSAEYNLRVLAAQRGSATGGRSLTRHHASTSSIDDFGKWYRQHPPAKSADSGGALTGSGTHGVPHGVSGGTRANAIPQPLASRDRVAEMSTRHRTSGLTRRSSASAIVPGPTAGGGGRGGGTDGPKLTLRPRPRRESASTATGHRFQRSNSGRSNSGDSLDVPASTPERGGSASASVSTAGTGRPPVSPSPSSRRGRGGATSTESGSDRGEHKGHRERGESTRDRDRGRPSSIELAAQRSPTARRGLRRGQSVGSLGIGASAEGGGSTRERDREHSTHRDRGPPRSISGTSHQSSDSDLTAFFAEVETVAAEQERSYASVRRIYSDGTGSGSKKGAKPSGSKVARSLNSSPILSMKSPRSHRRSSSGGDLDDLVEGGYLAPPAEHTTPPTPLHGGRLPSPRLGRPSPNTRRASESGRRVTSARVGPPKPPRGKPSSKRPATAAARKSTRVPW